MDLFFAQLFGIYFVVIGVVVALRRASMMPTITNLVANRAVLLLLAAIELAAGIALVLAYPVISFDLQGIISAIGWMMVVESFLYLVLPARMAQRFVGYFNHEGWYIWGGIFSILIGLYLTGIGFGFI